nr:MAG TPA: hypothetical protein [Microviridae sp.]
MLVRCPFIQCLAWLIISKELLWLYLFGLLPLVLLLFLL